MTLTVVKSGEMHRSPQSGPLIDNGQHFKTLLPLEHHWR